MSNLFKKAAVFTDLHLGLKSNSIVHNYDCEKFIDWFIETAKNNNCETGLFLGDWNHHRASINLHTLNFGVRLLEKLNDAFTNFYFLTGNHDLYYRDRRDVHGVEWAKHLPNIHVINDWFLEGDVAIVPWLCGEDHRRIMKIKSKYVFGHFELPTFRLNSMVEMPDHGGLQISDFSNIDKVFSGHFHVRQKTNNIQYIGNAFPHNFSDEGDSDRGCMILEWGKEPEFHSWSEQPLYRVLNLSSLLDNADSILKPNMSVRVNLDINISYEEATFIKETFVNSHGLREISLLPNRNHDLEYQQSIDISKFHSVDQIIHEQLSVIESDNYDKGLLMSIYQNL